MAVYPPRMAPSGLKLWGNAFQMNPDISSFDLDNHKSFGFLVEDARIPGQDACVLDQDTCVLAQDTCVLARGGRGVIE